MVPTDSNGVHPVRNLYNNFQIVILNKTLQVIIELLCFNDF